MSAMEPIDVFKALSNETRLNILKWLKEPEKHFPKQGAHLPKEVSYKGAFVLGIFKKRRKFLNQRSLATYI